MGLFFMQKGEFSKAEAAMEANNLDEADRILSEILEKDKDSVEALFNRGYLRQRRGQYAEALVDLNYLIEIRPDNAIALMLKGEVLLDMRDFEAAYGVLKKACEMEKDNGRAFCSFAKAAAALGKRHEAIDYLEQALHFEQHYTMASVLTDLWMEKH